TAARDLPGPGQRPPRQDLHPPLPRPARARAVRRQPRGVQRRPGHPAAGKGRRGCHEVGVHEQDERGEAAPRLGGADPAARRGLRGGERGHRLRGAARRRPHEVNRPDHATTPARRPAGAGTEPEESMEKAVNERVHHGVRHPTRPGEDVWSGTWVAERLGVELVGDDTLTGLLGLALRRNPRRAHLLVSQVLGKHVPRSPSVVYGHGVALGRRVGDLLGGAAGRAVVLGYAETATGLGHSVADGLGTAPYLHSTRRPVPGVPTAGGFEESHSHATSHLLLPEDPRLLAGDGPLVLVDDEFSTGNTVLNTDRALHARYPRPRYVIVALVDMRSPADAGRLDAFAREIGARIDLVTTASGTVRLPEDVLEKGRELVAAHERAAGGPETSAAAPGTLPPAAGADRVTRVDLRWPAGLPDGGRHGFTPAHRSRLDAALPAMAARLADALPAGARRVLVLGCEELMYAPLRLAHALERLAPGTDVRFSTTTRSPVLAVDDPGYAIRTRLVFPAHDDPADGPGERYAYNVAGAGFDAVVAVVASAADTPALHAPGGLAARLAAHIPHVLLAVVPSYVPDLRDAPRGARSDAPERPAGMLPDPLRGPAFSSYAPEEVGWLLQDLSDVTLEAPTEEREEAIQSGGAHYAESLPVEYQPSEQYQQLFHAALDASAARLAHAVGVVTETVLAERSPRPVLVSLARAGTPVGILMRRWAQYRHGLDLPHYAVSIVRGRGIDANALHWLAAHHDPPDVVFVD